MNLSSGVLRLQTVLKVNDVHITLQRCVKVTKHLFTVLLPIYEPKKKEKKKKIIASVFSLIIVHLKKYYTLKIVCNMVLTLKKQLLVC